MSTAEPPTWTSRHEEIPRSASESGSEPSAPTTTPPATDSASKTLVTDSHRNIDEGDDDDDGDDDDGVVQSEKPANETIEADLPAPEAPLFIVPSAPPDAQELQRYSTSATDNETYPEGGLRAWLVVLGCWLALIASLGLMNTLATFQSYLISHQLAAYGEGTVGWIFSIYTFVVFFLGLYIGPIFDKYGPRWIVMAGTVCIIAGMMLMSISSGKSVLRLL